MPDPTNDQPTQPPPPTPGPDGLEAYNRVAETVGLVPNLRLKDNLGQLIAVVVGVVLGAIAGAIIARVNGGAGTDLLIGAAIGAALGFILFGFLSGIVLMVIGWIRALTGWKNHKKRG